MFRLGGRGQRLPGIEAAAQRGDELDAAGKGVRLKADQRLFGFQQAEAGLDGVQPRAEAGGDADLVEPHRVAQAGDDARLGLEILTATEQVRQRPDAFDVPLYLFHGTADTLTEPDGTRWLAEHAATDDVTLTIYDGYYHETMNEPERDDVIAALADWIDAKIETAESSR